MLQASQLKANTSHIPASRLEAATSHTPASRLEAVTNNTSASQMEAEQLETPINQPSTQPSISQPLNPSENQTEGSQKSPTVQPIRAIFAISGQILCTVLVLQREKQLLCLFLGLII